MNRRSIPSTTYLYWLQFPRWYSSCVNTGSFNNWCRLIPSQTFSIFTLWPKCMLITGWSLEMLTSFKNLMPNINGSHKISLYCPMLTHIQLDKLLRRSFNKLYLLHQNVVNIKASHMKFVTIVALSLGHIYFYPYTVKAELRFSTTETRKWY